MSLIILRLFLHGLTCREQLHKKQTSGLVLGSLSSQLSDPVGVKFQRPFLIVKMELYVFLSVCLSICYINVFLNCAHSDFLCLLVSGGTRIFKGPADV